MQNILKYSAFALAAANAQSTDTKPEQTQSLDPEIPEQSVITVPKDLAKLACYLIEDGLVFNLSDLASSTYDNSGDLNSTTALLHNGPHLPRHPNKLLPTKSTRIETSLLYLPTMTSLAPSSFTKMMKVLTINRGLISQSFIAGTLDGPV